MKIGTDKDVHPTDVLPETPTTVAEPGAAPGGERRIVALDGLRGLAVLAVVLYHLLGLVGHTNPLLRACLVSAQVGWVGVDLFFALSGFLITGILADAAAAPGAALPRYLGAFYGRRCLRIFPLYYGVLAAALLAGLLAPALRTPGFWRFVGDQPWLLLYGVNVGIGVHGAGRFQYDWLNLTQFWTLAVEEHFYLCWPLAVWWLGRRRTMALAAALFVGSLGVRAWLVGMPDGWVRGALATPASAGSLAAGAFAALWLRSEADAAGARRAFRRAALAGAAAAVAVGWWAGGFHRHAPLVRTLGIAALGVLFAGAVGHAAAGGNAATRWLLERRPLVTLGKYSYGLYVFHFLFLPLYTRSGFPTWFRSYSAGAAAYLAIALAVSSALTLASWHLYEKHVLRLKRHLPY